MASAAAALALLKSNPASAMQRFGFLVESSVYVGAALGGPCQLQCSKANDSVFTLTAQAGAGDYLFPYANGHAGVGSCQVPVGAANGTVVVTGGMNGCSMQVNKTGTHYHFYHDNNGSSMAAAGLVPPGAMVARVDYKDYAGPMEIGGKLALQYLSEKRGAGYEYYCISVLVSGTWKIHVSSLIRITTRKTAFWSGKDYNSIKFVPFNPSVTSLMASF